MNLGVSAVLSVSALVIFTVASAVVVGLLLGRDRMPRRIRWLTADKQGGVVRLFLAVLWATALLVLSKLMIWIAFDSALTAGDVIAMFPPAIELVLAAVWSVYLARAYGG